MIQKRNTGFFLPERVAGIEVTLLSEKSYIINSILLEKKKGKAVISQTFYDLKDLSELRGKLPPFIPVALVVNGKGLIHKRTKGPIPALSGDILPGVNPADFLFQQFQLPEETDIAIVRKSTIDHIIEELGSMNILVNGIGLAYYSIGFISNHISHGAEISTTQYTLNYAPNSIRQYRLNTQVEKELVLKPEVAVENDYIRGNFILAYAAALKQLVKYEGTDEVLTKRIQQNREKLKEQFMIKRFTLSFLAIVLILLLINFLVYTHYFNKNNELVSENQLSLQEGERLDSLKKSIGSKKNFLAAAGWLDDRRMISYYADRIAATVPDSVTLLTLNINPAFSKGGIGSKQWEFKQDSILITGDCTDPTLLDQWLKQMQEIKNVKQSKITSYVQRKSDDSGIFTAEILLK